MCFARLPLRFRDRRLIDLPHVGKSLVFEHLPQAFLFRFLFLQRLAGLRAQMPGGFLCARQLLCGLRMRMSSPLIKLVEFRNVFRKRLNPAAQPGKIPGRRVPLGQKRLVLCRRPFFLLDGLRQCLPQRLRPLCQFRERFLRHLQLLGKRRAFCVLFQRIFQFLPRGGVFFWIIRRQLFHLPAEHKEGFPLLGKARGRPSKARLTIRKCPARRLHLLPEFFERGPGRPVFR